MVGWIIADMIYSVKLINYFNDNYSDTKDTVFRPSTTKCNNLFKVNSYGYLVIGIISCILGLLQILKLLQLYKNFFLVKYVEHSARCEDENIIVIS